jgi:hypothetical protein
MPSHSPAGEDMNEMQHDAGSHPDAAQSAHEAMSGHHMDMNAHMFMTELRPENSADDAHAAAIVVTVRNAIEKYKDYRVALADGFQIFHPEAPQQHYHFTNYRYAARSRPRTPATKPAAAGFRRFLIGWSTSIPTRRIRKISGRIENLPQRGVDTGMGE